MNKTFAFTLNGKQVSVEADTSASLLTVLRNHLDKTGTKFSCGIGECGACTVLLDNEITRSCMIAIEDVENKKVLTIEGLASDGKLHPIQKSFVKHDALQCGFCTPGMIMNGLGLVLENPEINRGDIVKGMDANLCRCGAYNRIVDAIEEAAKNMNKKVQL
jgi:carbon-monoxide dehydrogenase small subunit